MNLGIGLMLGSRQGGFVPTALGGAVLWLRSDLGVTTSGGEVTGWADQSGAGDAGRNFAPAGTDRPAYNASEAGYNNRPTVGTFNKAGLASDCRLVSGTWSATYANPLTIIVVGHGMGDASNRYFCSESATDALAVFAHTGGAQTYTGAVGGTSIVAAGALGTDVPGCVTMFEVNGPANSALYVDKLVTADATGAADPSTLGDAPYSVGSYGGAGTVATTYGCERLAEVLIFNRLLANPEKVQLRDYLNSLYGKSMTS